MARVAILGATGSLGKHLVRQALAEGHEVSVLVRTPARLPADERHRVSVRTCDLSSCSPAELTSWLEGHDAVINAAGVVTEGQRFVDLVDRIVGSLEAMAPSGRPACWFLAGVSVLDIDRSGRRGVDLPRIGRIYAPHRVNFERLQRTDLDWRLLCPGPMVEREPLGTGRLRVGVDRLPVDVPKIGARLPGPLLLPVFGYLIPEMIIPYADAASFVLAHLARGGPLSGHRVGLALPAGMRGRKDRWIARPQAPS